MPLYNMGITTELTQQTDTMMPVFLLTVWEEIIMQAVEISTSLIMPAGGTVDQSCTIIFPDIFRDPCGIKLSPALIEWNPAADTGEGV